jgi:hypothetical protein
MQALRLPGVSDLLRGETGRSSDAREQFVEAVRLALDRDGTECSLTVRTDTGTTVIVSYANGATLRGRVPVTESSMSTFPNIRDAQLLAKGVSFVGDVQHHEFVGSTLVTFGDSVYLGEMVQGRPHGRGTLTTPQMHVEGTWAAGEPSGVCIARFDDPSAIGADWLVSALASVADEQVPSRPDPVVPVEPTRPAPAPVLGTNTSSAGPAAGPTVGTVIAAQASVRSRFDDMTPVVRTPLFGRRVLRPVGEPVCRPPDRVLERPQVTDQRAGPTPPAEIVAEAANPGVDPDPCERPHSDAAIAHARAGMGTHRFVYEGEWKSGVFHGIGALIGPGFEYAGHFRAGRMHGAGTFGACVTRMHSYHVHHTAGQLIARQSKSDFDAERAQLAIQQLQRRLTHDSSTCKICYDAVATVLLLPCRHMVSCRTCYNRGAQLSGSCPVCRTRVDDTIAVIRA